MEDTIKITVIDRNFNIVYSRNANSRFDNDLDEGILNDYIGKNLFDLYPSLEKSDSSIYEAATLKKTIVRTAQRFRSFEGIDYCTNNISIPIIEKGEVTSIIEISRNIEPVNKSNGKNKISSLISDKLSTDFENISFEDIISEDEKMIKSIDVARRLALLPTPVLIYGESGTGKELVVQAMINYSNISRNKVVIQNCASVPENLIESILFGSVKGAYTGSENRKGLFEIANDGILFLDELNSLPYHLQGKLLRVIQDGSFRPVGSQLMKKVKVKIIAAMNVEPNEAIENKTLRKDLFYRLSNGIIRIPSLKERINDIELYINHFTEIYNDVYDKKVTGITEDLKGVMLNLDWAGNVRELKNAIEAMICQTDDEVLTVEHLPAYIYETISIDSGFDSFSEQVLNDVNMDLNKRVEEIEKNLIRKALHMNKGSVTKSAKLLNITRQTLKYKLNKYEIDKIKYKNDK